MKSVLAMLTLSMANPGYGHFGYGPRECSGYELAANDDTYEQERSAA